MSLVEARRLPAGQGTHDINNSKSIKLPPHPIDHRKGLCGILQAGCTKEAQDMHRTGAQPAGIHTFGHLCRASHHHLCFGVRDILKHSTTRGLARLISHNNRALSSKSHPCLQGVSHNCKFLYIHFVPPANATDEVCRIVHASTEACPCSLELQRCHT
eukprot:353839-Chlamydomonas_euryale.AAC.47